MSTSYKILGQTAPSAATETLNYNAGHQSLVRSINITNTSSTADTYSISILPSNSSSAPALVAAGGSYAAYTTDGNTWLGTSLPHYDNWSGVVWGNGNFVATTNNSTSFAYSSDAITWTSVGVPYGFWGAAVFGNNKFIAIDSQSGNVISSTDGTSWSQVTTIPFGNGEWYSLTFGNGKFVAVDFYSSTAAYSEDGITWTQTGMPFSGFWEVLIFANGTFVAADNGYNRVAYSTDGINWSGSNWSNQVSILSGAAVNGVFFLTSRGTSYAYSTDGINWSTSNFKDGIYWGGAIAYINNQYVALNGNQNPTNVSSDGINWTDASGPGNSLYNMCFGYQKTENTTSNANYIALNVNIDGNSTTTIKGGYTLDANAGIRVTSTNGTSTFTTFGAEIA